MTTQRKRKTKAAAQAEQRVAVTAEFTALAFVMAAQDILKEQHEWADDMAAAFGEELWRKASGRMVSAIHAAAEREKAQ